MSRNIRGRLRGMFNELQVFGRMRLRHQGAIFAADQAVSNPGRILVAGNADPMVERTTAQPAEKNVFVRELAAVLTLLLSPDQIKHRNRTRRTSGHDPMALSRTPPSC